MLSFLSRSLSAFFCLFLCFSLFVSLSVSLFLSSLYSSLSPLFHTFSLSLHEHIRRALDNFLHQALALSHHAPASQAMSVALVTGGAGFLGSHLVRLILSGDPQAGIPPSRDYSLVRVLDLRPFDIDAALSNATAARQALSKAQPMSNTTDNITCSAAVATDTATPVDDVNLTISRVESMVGSVSDMETVRRAVAGVDVVFHVAALVDWGQASYDALFTVRRFCLGGSMSVSAYISSCSVLCVCRYSLLCRRLLLCLC